MCSISSSLFPKHFWNNIMKSSTITWSLYGPDYLRGEKTLSNRNQGSSNSFMSDDSNLFHLQMIISAAPFILHTPSTLLYRRTFLTTHLHWTIKTNVLLCILSNVYRFYLLTIFLIFNLLCIYILYAVMCNVHVYACSYMILYAVICSFIMFVERVAWLLWIDLPGIICI